MIVSVPMSSLPMKLCNFAKKEKQGSSLIEEIIHMEGKWLSIHQEGSSVKDIHLGQQDLLNVLNYAGN